MTADLSALAWMRLAEHAVHVWDVAVSLDPGAVVAPDAVALLLPRLASTAARSGQAADPAFRVLLTTTDGLGAWVVDAGESASLESASAGASYDGEVSLPAEALLRLVYGRLDPDPRRPVSGQSWRAGGSPTSAGSSRASEPRSDARAAPRSRLSASVRPG